MVESWVFFYIEDGWNYLMGSGYGNSFFISYGICTPRLFLLFLPPFCFLYHLAFLGGNYFEVMLLTIFLSFLPSSFSLANDTGAPWYSHCACLSEIFILRFFNLYGDVVDTIWTRRLREIS